MSMLIPKFRPESSLLLNFLCKFLMLMPLSCSLYFYANLFFPSYEPENVNPINFIKMILLNDAYIKI